MTTRPSYAAVSQHDSFEHERLKLHERSIRLFQIQNSTSANSVISLRMTQFSTQRRPAYKAISYTWGSALHPKRILVNGRVFELHLNLWTLLQHLRQWKDASFFWADALCINQLNLKERNFHVQLMGRIYEKAESVIVWLGPTTPDPTAKIAFDFIRELSAFRKAKSLTEFANVFFTTDMKRRWDVLLDMCRHDYWTRTWVIQEFLFAPRIEVMTGLSVLRWTEFEILVDALQQESRSAQYPPAAELLRTRTARLTLHRRAGSLGTLHDLLKEYNDSACTERKDKVYGILGLAADCLEDPETGESRGVTPDYNKHVIDVFLDVISCIQSSLSFPTALPSVVYLVKRCLHITQDDLVEYVNLTYDPSVDAKHFRTILDITPEYVSPIVKTWPAWSGGRDLQQKLETHDWGEQLGWEIRRVRSSDGRKSSARQIHSDLPADFAPNILSAAELSPLLTSLHNYDVENGFIIRLDQITAHAEDKRLFDNAMLAKPTVILEKVPNANTVRVGFACTNTHRNDVIVQFRGLDYAFIARVAGHKVTLVGRAIMIQHSSLSYEDVLDPMCKEKQWVSHCLCQHNPDALQIEADPFSLAELFSWT